MAALQGEQENFSEHRNFVLAPFRQAA